MPPSSWRAAVHTALYDPEGFYRREVPDDHFATSANSSPLFAEAVVRVLTELDAVLDRPDPFTLVDVGAGTGALLTRVVDGVASTPLAARLDPVCVELRPRPGPLPDAIGWRETPPTGVTGAVLACEWLDNIPLDVGVVDEEGVLRRELVDAATGDTSYGDPLTDSWAETWWPAAEPGQRVEIGRPRDLAWASLVSSLAKGLALAVDYGHTRTHRPPYGTLTGYAHGRQLPPVPDGSMDVTAHVAVDAVAAAGAAAGATATSLVRQAEALRGLGFTGERPPQSLATSDPAAYVRRLGAATRVAELSDPYGSGAHWWLAQRVGC